MLDYEGYSAYHTQAKLTIVEANIDVDIIPLIDWLNSFNGIMTRWSCAGKRGSPPYIIIWIDKSPTRLSFIKKKLNYPSVNIEPICTQSDIHIYRIGFASKKEMKRIQKEITGQ